jgi:hypothetical protein
LDLLLSEDPHNSSFNLIDDDSEATGRGQECQPFDGLAGGIQTNDTKGTEV